MRWKDPIQQEFERRQTVKRLTSMKILSRQNQQLKSAVCEEGLLFPPAPVYPLCSLAYSLTIANACNRIHWMDITTS